MFKREATFILESFRHSESGVEIHARFNGARAKFWEIESKDEKEGGENGEKEFPI
jgi:hypothetical protein